MLFLHKCNLPLTGTQVVDMLITDLAVYQIDRKRGVYTLIELATDVSLEEVKEKTEADFAISGTL